MPLILQDVLVGLIALGALVMLVQRVRAAVGGGSRPAACDTCALVDAVQAPAGRPSPPSTTAGPSAPAHSPAVHRS